MHRWLPPKTGAQAVDQACSTEMTSSPTHWNLELAKVLFERAVHDFGDFSFSVGDA